MANVIENFLINTKTHLIQKGFILQTMSDEQQLNQSNEEQLEQSNEEKNEEGKRPIDEKLDEKLDGTPVTDKKRRTKQRTPLQKTNDIIKDALEKVKGVSLLRQEELFDIFVADSNMPPRNGQPIKQYLVEQTPTTITGHATLRQLIQNWIHSCASFISNAEKLSKKHQQEILAQMTELANTLRKNGYNEESITQTLMKGPQNDATLIQQVIENLK